MPTASTDTISAELALVEEILDVAETTDSMKGQEWVAALEAAEGEIRRLTLHTSGKLSVTVGEDVEVGSAALLAVAQKIDRIRTQLGELGFTEGSPELVAEYWEVDFSKHIDRSNLREELTALKDGMTVQD